MMKAVVKTMYAQVKQKKESELLPILRAADKKRFERKYQEYLKGFKKIQ